MTVNVCVNAFVIASVCFLLFGGIGTVTVRPPIGIAVLLACISRFSGKTLFIMISGNIEQYGSLKRQGNKQLYWEHMAEWIEQRSRGLVFDSHCL